VYHGIKAVEAKGNHLLVLQFDNEDRRVFDVKPLLSIGRFRELSDLEQFKKVAIAFDTIAWENGLDLDPEYLYDKSRTMECEPSA
jgi:hypothetical protein